MAVFRELFEARLALFEKEQELKELKLEYESYRTIVESPCNNKNVRKTKEHISWYGPDELKKKAQEIMEEEWLEYSREKAKRQERREGRRREGRREREEKKRAAERKALDELMEKERKERRNRKNQEAN